MSTNVISAWAVPQLSSLLPLPEDELEQVVSYALTSPDISTPAAAEAHFKDLLGHSPEVLSFVEGFSKRRFGQQQQQQQPPEDEGPPRGRKKAVRKKEPLNKLPPPRKPNEGFSNSNENL